MSVINDEITVRDLRDELALHDAKTAASEKCDEFCAICFRDFPKTIETYLRATLRELDFYRSR